MENVGFGRREGWKEGNGRAKREGNGDKVLAKAGVLCHSYKCAAEKRESE